MKKFQVLIILMLIVVAATATSQETASGPGKPQILEFSNGKAVLCVNCPYITDLENGGKQIICKDQEQTCDLYLGFVKTKEQEYTQDGKKYTYQFADSDEFSTKENNFVIKSVTAESAISSGQSYLDMPDGRENILKEIEDKAISTASKDTYYKLDSLITADYALIQNGIINLNSQGEITEVIGTAKKAAKQKLVSMIDEKARIDVPLKHTEKLTFRGLDAKDGYKFLEPVLEVYNPDKKDLSFEKWLTLIDEEYKSGTKGGAFIDRLCSTDIFYYAPGSKFQIRSATKEQECDLKRYILTTGISKGNTDLGQYKCGEITYIAEPGKLNDLYCDQDKSEINCRGNKNCQQSELQFIADATNNEIGLGTNDFIADSKFESLKKTSEGYNLKAGEIKLGRDYLFPEDGEANVVTVPFFTPKHAGLKVRDGTTLVREWLDKDVVHNLRKTTENENVNYIVSIFQGSTGQSARIDAVYPEHYSLSEHGMTEEEKNIYSMFGPMPEKEGDKWKIYDIFLEAGKETRVHRLPTLGITVEPHVPLAQPIVINYFAIPLKELSGKRKEEIKSNIAGDKILINKGEDILDVLTQYCFPPEGYAAYSRAYEPSYSNLQDSDKRKAISELAEKILKDADNEDSPNAGIFKQGFNKLSALPLSERSSDYFLALKTGDMTIPGSAVSFKAKKGAVTVHKQVCGIKHTAKKIVVDNAKASGRQTCERNAHKVQSGDSLRQIYDARCTDDYKASTKPLQFKQWVLSEANNPGLAKRKTWHDKIFPGDEICIPEGCDAPQRIIGKVTVLEGGKRKKPSITLSETQIECPNNEFDCIEGADTQDPALTKKQRCDMYSKALTLCENQCYWEESAESCLMGGSIKSEKIKSANKKIKEKVSQGRRVTKAISSVIDFSGIKLPTPGEPKIETAADKVSYLSHSSAAVPVGSLSRDNPQITITLTPNALPDAVADFQLKEAYIDKEQLRCRYQMGKDQMTTLTNINKLAFKQNLPKDDLKQTKYTDAQNKAKSYLEKYIKNFCTELVIADKLSYDIRNWKTAS